MVSCEKSMIDEMNSNTVNFLDDVDEIINKKEALLTYVDFITNFLV